MFKDGFEGSPGYWSNVKSYDGYAAIWVLEYVMTTASACVDETEFFEFGNDFAREDLRQFGHILGKIDLPHLRGCEWNTNRSDDAVFDLVCRDFFAILYQCFDK